MRSVEQLRIAAMQCRRCVQFRLRGSLIHRLRTHMSPQQLEAWNSQPHLSRPSGGKPSSLESLPPFSPRFALLKALPRNMRTNGLLEVANATVLRPQPPANLLPRSNMRFTSELTSNLLYVLRLLISMRLAPILPLAAPNNKTMTRTPGVTSRNTKGDGITSDISPSPRSTETMKGKTHPSQISRRGSDGTCLS